PLMPTGPATTQIYPLSLHDALPISGRIRRRRRPSLEQHLQRLAGGGEGERAGDMGGRAQAGPAVHLQRCVGAQLRAYAADAAVRSEEHTSELQSRENLVCRLLLEKK